MGEHPGEWPMVAEFGNHPEAELARNLLAKHGIRAVVWSDDCGGLAGGQTFVKGVRVFVQGSDRQAAMEVLGQSTDGG